MTARARVGLLCCLLAMGSATALAQAPDNTAVRATVALPDGTPVATSVTLVVDDGAQEVYAREIDSDADGVAVFTDVPAGAGLHARAWAAYQGARYGSGVSLVEGPGAELSVTVFPVTTEGRPLHVDTVHLIVQVESPELYRVLQFVTVLNTGDAAYAGGPALADGRRAGLVIPVPEQASNVRSAPFPSPAEALSAADTEIGTDRVLDGRPVPPGGRQVAVTYDLQAVDGELTAAIALPYPVQLANLLVGGPAADLVEMSSPTLRPGDPQDIGGESYDLWAAEALPPGAEIAFTLAPPALALLPYHWALMGLGLALIAALGASLHGGGSPSLQQERLRSLTEGIAQLDLEHERGEIDAGAYFKRRGAELERLALLQQTVHGSDDAG